MFDYIIEEMYHGYDLNKPDGKQRTMGGGMTVKVARLREIFADRFPGVRFISSLEDIEERHIIVDSMFCHSLHDRAGYDILLDTLRSHYSVLACYELAMMKMGADKAFELANAASVVTANCEFLQKVLGYQGVARTTLVPEPVPDEFFQANSDRERAVVAMGQIAWFKNSGRVAEVFKLLEGSGIKRIYIGSCKFWQNTEPLNEQLQEQIYAHCDEVKHNITQAELIETLSGASVGLWVSMLDVFATSLHEMFAAGLPVVGCNHGLSAEVPLSTYTTAEEQAHAIKELVSSDLDELRPELSGWARKRCSVETFLTKTTEALKLASYEETVTSG